MPRLRDLARLAIVAPFAAGLVGGLALAGISYLGGLAVTGALDSILPEEA